MRIFVAIATIDRAETLRQVISHLGAQTRLPDGIVVVGVKPSDVEGLATASPGPEVIFAPRGLCAQRNRALAHIGSRADVILFLDDDFVPADDYLAELERLFAAQPDVVGATGRVIADGVGSAGIAFGEALALIETEPRSADAGEYPERALYGCNMAIRVAAIGTLRFDEALPLYGWLEDIDMTYQLGRRGRLVRSYRLTGVHMGVKQGRTSGVRLGYSQIANPVYLLRKRSAPPKLAWQMMFRNFGSNLFGSFVPRAPVDRRGRLRGNLLAIAHLATLRLDPRRILELRT